MDTLVNYADTESFLFSQLPMFQRVGPKAFKTDLHNIEHLLELLGNPEKHLKCLHIAGTNGKGSSSFLIASALHEMGYKVGLYTSPHYKTYRERIRINAEMIDEDYVIEFVNKLIRMNVFESDLRPSFFEITVAMAFQYFKDRDLDYVVVETGLGGRLDSTNVIHPLISLITNIGMDHTAFLGDRLELIAAEKAGIIKQNVPVVIGKTQEETREVFLDKASEMDADIVFADKQERIELLESISRNFPAYQYENIYSAYYVLRSLFAEAEIKDILETAWSEGLRKWGFIGRYSVMGHAPKLIFDSAHNPQGVQSLMAEVAREEYEDLHIVLAVVADKDLSQVLDLYPEDANYYFSNARIPRAMKGEVLKSSAEVYGLEGRVYEDLESALASAKNEAGIKDLILVTGSIFTVAELI